MGNTTINKHQSLSKNIKKNTLESNLIIYDIPITFSNNRRTQSYVEQMEESSETELINTIYNKLYLTKLGVTISKDKVVIKNEINLKDELRVLQTYDKNTCSDIDIYKHFTYDDEPVPIEIQISIDVIKNLQLQIQSINNLIEKEKNKIIRSKYVQSKLDKPPDNVNEYVDTIKYLAKSFKSD